MERLRLETLGMTSTKFKAYIVLEFDNVKIDSDKAKQIIEDINDTVETIKIGFEANSCYLKCYEEVNEHLST